MDWFLVSLIGLWILKIVYAYREPKPLSRETRMALAVCIPLFWLAYVFIWNTWAHHWISFPVVTSAKQFLILMLVF